MGVLNNPLIPDYAIYFRGDKRSAGIVLDTAPAVAGLFAEQIFSAGFVDLIHWMSLRVAVTLIAVILIVLFVRMILRLFDPELRRLDMLGRLCEAETLFDYLRGANCDKSQGETSTLLCNTAQWTVNACSKYTKFGCVLRLLQDGELRTVARSGIDPARLLNSPVLSDSGQLAALSNMFGYDRDFVAICPNVERSATRGALDSNGNNSFGVRMSEASSMAIVPLVDRSGDESPVLIGMLFVTAPSARSLRSIDVDLLILMATRVKSVLVERNMVDKGARFERRMPIPHVGRGGASIDLDGNKARVRVRASACSERCFECSGMVAGKHLVQKP